MLKLLCQTPKACLRTNGRISERFPLQSGIRQGCTLCPSGFSLALESLPNLVRASQQVEVLWIGPLKEKVSLYADDTLLYLLDMDSSFCATLVLYDEFGGFSGVGINWTKYVLFPLDPLSQVTAANTPLQWVNSFKYLGIQMQHDPNKLNDLNIDPVLVRLGARCASWGTLPLNLLGHINRIK